MKYKDMRIGKARAILGIRDVRLCSADFFFLGQDTIQVRSSLSFFRYAGRLFDLGGFVGMPAFPSMYSLAELMEHF